MEIKEIETCTGCAACANACPKGAIKIIQDKEGFYKPQIDNDLCTNCTLCQQCCPQQKTFDKNLTAPECYAVMADDETRMKSSSGGAFGIIAEEILNRNGIICGAAFDENWTVRHILIDNKQELEKLRGSKYLQSFISETLMKNIKEHLDNGKYVLFVGVPCQVAGLLSYLKKDYERLYTIDLICAYAPSAKVFKQYIDENYSDVNLKKINFRDKNINGWNCTFTTTTTTDGLVLNDSKYMKPYLDRMFKGTQCVECKYKKLPRPADFTIGDFWKIQQFTNDCDDRKGTSGVLLNNSKAKELFKTIEKQFKKVKPMPLHTLAWQIDVKHKIPRTKSCIDFFKNIDSKPYNQNSIEADKNIKVGIINWWYVNNKGAILTNYALNEMVKELGYDAYTINYVHPIERRNFPNSFAEKFAEKYIKRTRPIASTMDLKSLNNDLGTFICGSDQIFRYFCCHAHDDIFYLNWADAQNNKLISYSASFAVNEFKANEYQKNLVKHWLHRFERHSIREFDGVDIMKNTFGLNAEQVLDPVFCIDTDKYNDLAEKSTNKTDEDFIAYYIMWPTETNSKILDFIKEKLNISKTIHLNQPMAIEDWLWYIKNAKFILTDSFHASCFSIIFNKQFAVIPNPKEYPSRFLSIDKISGLSSRFFYTNESIYDSTTLFEPIDYTNCDKNLQIEIERSKNWLENALKAPKTNFLTEEQRMYDTILYDIEDKKEHINRLHAEISSFKNEYKNILYLLSQQNKIKNKYRFYRFVTNITFGKCKQKFKDKKNKYKNLYKKIKDLYT